MVLDAAPGALAMLGVPVPGWPRIKEDVERHVLGPLLEGYVNEPDPCEPVEAVDDDVGEVDEDVDDAAWFSFEAASKVQSFTSLAATS